MPGVLTCCVCEQEQQESCHVCPSHCANGFTPSYHVIIHIAEIDVLVRSVRIFTKGNEQPLTPEKVPTRAMLSHEIHDRRPEPSKARSAPTVGFQPLAPRFPDRRSPGEHLCIPGVPTACAHDAYDQNEMGQPMCMLAQRTRCAHGMRLVCVRWAGSACLCASRARTSPALKTVACVSH